MDKGLSFRSEKLRESHLSSIQTNPKTGFDSCTPPTLVLLGLLCVYFFNATFNVLYTQALRTFLCTLTNQARQFTVVSTIMASNSVLRMTKSLPPSLGKMSVALTHTVKATKPSSSINLTPSNLQRADLGDHQVTPPHRCRRRHRVGEQNVDQLARILLRNRQQPHASITQRVAQSSYKHADAGKTYKDNR